MNNGRRVQNASGNQASERSPGVAIRCGCSAGDEYGYGAGDIKRGDTPKRAYRLHVRSHPEAAYPTCRGDGQ
jgi:hypothetical protein